MKLFTNIFIVSLLISSNISGQKPINLDGEKILDSMVTKYLHISQYNDSTFNKTFYENDESNPSYSYFSTFFIRPYYFEIDGTKELKYNDQVIQAGYYYHMKNDKSISWIKRGERPIIIDSCSFNIGIAKLVGSFGNAASSISWLLFPETIQAADKFKKYDFIEKIEDEKIDDKDCYVIHLFFYANHDPAKKTPNLERNAFVTSDKAYEESLLIEGTHAKYWIDKKEFLLVKRRFTIVKKDTNNVVQESRIYPYNKKGKQLTARVFAY